MLTRLVPDIKRTAELVEEITAAAANRMSARRRSSAIQQLDQVTQQNAAARTSVVDLGGTDLAGRAIAGDDRVLQDRRGRIVRACDRRRGEQAQGQSRDDEGAVAHSPAKARAQTESVRSERQGLRSSCKRERTSDAHFKRA